MPGSSTTQDGPLAVCRCRASGTLGPHPLGTQSSDPAACSRCGNADDRSSRKQDGRASVPSSSAAISRE